MRTDPTSEPKIILLDNCEILTHTQSGESSVVFSGKTNENLYNFYINKFVDNQVPTDVLRDNQLFIAINGTTHTVDHIYNDYPCMGWYSTSISDETLLNNINENYGWIHGGFGRIYEDRVEYTIDYLKK